MLRRTSLLFALIAVGLSIGARPAQSQTMSFMRQFTTSGIDRAYGVTADASGIYLIGIRPSAQGGQGGVRKYDSRGNVLWSREISVPAPGSIGLIKVLADATGIYVLGYTRPSADEAGQWFLRKYSVDGDELWTHRLEPLNKDVAVDATGVYVAGLDFAPDASYLRKYNPDGAELWTKQLGEPGNRYLPFSVIVDTTGVYVFGVVERSGPAFPASPAFPFARKYDLRGNELWTRQPSWFYSEIPWMFAAAYPTGYYILDLEIPGLFLRVRKYDSAGNELWNRRVAIWTDAGPMALSVAADASGVYVATSTVNRISSLPGHCRSGSGGDALVRKYGFDGAELWTRQFGTADGTLAAGVAVDDTGVYVAGREGTGPYREDWGDFLPDTGGAFLAKFEKTAATLTGPSPRIFSDCVVNAASYLGGGVAPAEMVTIFGAAIGPPELVKLRLTEDRRVATNLADTRILFNGVPAPLLSVSDKQSSAIVPYSVAGQSAVDVQVEYEGVLSEAVTVPVLASRPGIFSLDGSGQGQGGILNEDGSRNSPSNPAATGSIISIFATGGGEAAPGVLDGQIVDTVLPITSLPVSAFFDIGGLPSKQAEVLYAGGVRGSVAGLLQVKVRVPANLVITGDAVSFALIIGSHWTVYQVTVALR